MSRLGRIQALEWVWQMILIEEQRLMDAVIEADRKRAEEREARGEKVPKMILVSTPRGPENVYKEFTRGGRDLCVKVWQVNTNTTKETEMSLNNKEKAIVLAVRGIPAPFTAAEAAAAYNEANGGTDYTADSIAGPLSNIVKDGFANPAQFSLTELGQTADLG